MVISTTKTRGYKLLSGGSEEVEGECGNQTHSTAPLSRKLTIVYILSFVLSLITSFTAGVLLTVYVFDGSKTHSNESVIGKSMGIADHVSLPQIAGEFSYPSSFSKEPPREGNISEPAWDKLIPNGLGYFIPPTANNSNSKTSSVVIPSVFHQLHCLYLIRRAYYTIAPDFELQRFDLGRNRTMHVAHCFDYLAQSITCSADSTLEPAVDKKHGFLGGGFARRCFDFEYLKNVTENGRVFNASGFLAWGAGKDGRVELG